MEPKETQSKNSSEKEKSSASDANSKAEGARDREDEKSTSSAWSTETIVSGRAAWSLEGDIQGSLAHMISCQSLIGVAQEIHEELKNLSIETSSAAVEVSNLNSYLDVLGDSKFMENRVAEEEEPQPASNETSKVSEPSKSSSKGDVSKKQLEAVSKGLLTLQMKYEHSVVENSDSEDDDLPMRTTVLKARSNYDHRPLPHLIGTSEFYMDDTLGLADNVTDNDEDDFDTAETDEDDDDDSKSLDKSTESLARPYSRSEDGTALDRESEEEKNHLDNAQRKRPHSASAPMSSQAHSEGLPEPLDPGKLKDVRDNLRARDSFSDDLFDFQDEIERQEKVSQVPKAYNPVVNESPKPAKADRHSVDLEDAVQEEHRWIYPAPIPWSYTQKDETFPKFEKRKPPEHKQPSERTEGDDYYDYDPLAPKPFKKVLRFTEKDTFGYLAEKRRRSAPKLADFDPLEPPTPEPAPVKPKPKVGMFEPSLLFPPLDDDDDDQGPGLWSKEDDLWKEPAEPKSSKVEGDLFSTTPGQDWLDSSAAEKSTLPEKKKSFWALLDSDDEGNLFSKPRQSPETKNEPASNTKQEPTINTKPTTKAVQKSSLFEDESDDTGLFSAKPTREQPKTISLFESDEDDDDFFQTSLGSSKKSVTTSSTSSVEPLPKVPPNKPSTETLFKTPTPTPSLNESELPTSDDELFSVGENKVSSPPVINKVTPPSTHKPDVAPEKPAPAPRVVPPSIPSAVDTKPKSPVSSPSHGSGRESKSPLHQENVSTTPTVKASPSATQVSGNNQPNIPAPNKLKQSQLININVSALLPGAKSNKVKKTDISPQSSRDEEDEATVTDNDSPVTPQPPVSVLPSSLVRPRSAPESTQSPLKTSSSFPPMTEPLKTLTKERAKVSNSRKPSTRRGRIGRMPDQNRSRSVEREEKDSSPPSAGRLEASITGYKEEVLPQSSSVNVHPPPTHKPKDLFKPADSEKHGAGKFIDSSSSSEEAPLAVKEEKVAVNKEVPPSSRELPGNFLSSPFYDNQPPPLEVEDSGDLFDDLFPVTKSDEEEDDPLFGSVSTSMRDEPPPLHESTASAVAGNGLFDTTKQSDAKKSLTLLFDDDDPKEHQQDIFKSTPAIDEEELFKKATQFETPKQTDVEKSSTLLFDGRDTVENQQDISKSVPAVAGFKNASETPKLSDTKTSTLLFDGEDTTEHQQDIVKSTSAVAEDRLFKKATESTKQNDVKQRSTLFFDEQDTTENQQDIFKSTTAVPEEQLFKTTSETSKQGNDARKSSTLLFDEEDTTENQQDLFKSMPAVVQDGLFKKANENPKPNDAKKQSSLLFDEGNKSEHQQDRLKSTPAAAEDPLLRKASETPKQNNNTNSSTLFKEADTTEHQKDIFKSTSEGVGDGLFKRATETKKQNVVKPNSTSLFDEKDPTEYQQDLFGSKSAVAGDPLFEKSSSEISKQKDTKKKSNVLFDEEDPTELFSEKQVKKKENPPETPFTNTKLTKSSLFDDDDEDDLFNSAPAAQRPPSTTLAGGVSKAPKTAKPVKLKAEEVKDDPLSLMGGP